MALARHDKRRPRVRNTPESIVRDGYVVMVKDNGMHVERIEEDVLVLGTTDSKSL